MKWREIRKYPHRYGMTGSEFLRPRLLWNECYRGVAWAAWWAGWTNPTWLVR